MTGDSTRRKVFRAGNSLVISLPAEWLRSRGLQEGGEVEVSISEGDALQIRPASEAEISPDFARQVSEFIDRYRPALDELASR